MKRVRAAVGVGVMSAALVATVASPVFAWHPVGVISKQVQNVSQNSALAEANTAAQAVSAKPGDTLKYVITVKNNGTYDKRGWNDMHYTKVVDQLPAGVTLAAGATNKDLGHIAAGASKTYEFIATVTSKTNNAVVCNTASFTGDSEVKDQPQKGQDTACIKVVVPPTPKPPVTPETPTTPEVPKTPETPKTPEVPTETPEATPEMPAELPETGAKATGILAVSALTAATVAFLRRRQ